MLYFILVAESVAAFLYAQAFEGGAKQFKMDTTLMNELLQCYLVTAQCKYFNLSSTSNTPPTYGKAPKGPYPQYVGVAKSTTYHTIMTQRVLAYLTGVDVSEAEVDTKITPVSQADCKSKEDQNVWNYFYMKNSPDTCELCLDQDEDCDKTNVTCGVCKRTLSFFTTSVSPAFLIEV